MNQSRATILVGVIPGQPPAVVAAAATYAERFDADLVCATVDTSQYTVAALTDGSVLAMPIDPDAIQARTDDQDEQLSSMIEQALHDRPVSWSVRHLAGTPARELAKLADEIGALMIVIGTRERGIRGSLREFFNGSVAAQLAHRQHRPVIVIPLDPAGPDAALRWSQDENA